MTEKLDSRLAVSKYMLMTLPKQLQRRRNYFCCQENPVVHSHKVDSNKNWRCLHLLKVNSSFNSSKQMLTDFHFFVLFALLSHEAFAMKSSLCILEENLGPEWLSMVEPTSKNSQNMNRSSAYAASRKYEKFISKQYDKQITSHPRFLWKGFVHDWRPAGDLEFLFSEHWSKQVVGMKESQIRSTSMSLTMK